MNRFKSILFVAGDEGLTRVAFVKAAEFAALNDAEVTVLDVVEPVPERRRRFETETAVYDLQDLLIADGARRMEEMLAGIKAAADVPLNIVVAAGTPHVEIIRSVLSGGHDVVIIADAEDGYSPIVHHLLRKAPCPVWVMTPSIMHERRVLAAVDPSLPAPTQALLDDDVLTLAISLASRENAPLHIVHAWGLPRGAGFGMPAAHLEALREETVARHRDDLAALVERHPVPDDTVVHFLEGSPAKVVRHVVHRESITTIVMGTVARTGIAGLLIGNTAETILRRISCSVLAVKPSAFETPIHLP